MKKFKYNWKLIVPFLLILLAIGSYLGNKRYQAYKEQQVEDYYRKFLSYKPPLKIKKKEFLGDQAVAIDWENTDEKVDRYIPEENSYYGFSGKASHTSDYIVTEQTRLRSKTNGVSICSFTRNKLQKGEYWSVKVYKKSGQKLSSPTEIDIPKLVRKHNSDYYPSSLQVFERKGKSYLMIAINKIPEAHQKEQASDHFLYVDLDTKKTSGGGKMSISGRDSSLSDFAFRSDLDDKLEEQGLLLSYGNGNQSISLTKEGIKQSSHWQIAKKYPKVYKILKNGGKLYLMQDKTDMDYTVKILQLFAPKSKDIFDGVAIPSEYSTDGQAHTVTSYEEFKKYYKIEGNE